VDASYYQERESQQKRRKRWAGIAVFSSLVLRDLVSPNHLWFGTHQGGLSLDLFLFNKTTLLGFRRDESISKSQQLMRRLHI